MGYGRDGAEVLVLAPVMDDPVGKRGLAGIRRTVDPDLGPLLLEYPAYPGLKALLEAADETLILPQS